MKYVEVEKGATNKSITSLAPFLIVTPILANNFVEMKTRDPPTLLVESNSLISEFDRENKSNSLVNKALNNVKQLLYFCGQ